MNDRAYAVSVLVAVTILVVVIALAVYTGTEACHHKGGEPFWPQGLCLSADGRILR